jgi:hypothetical protein
LSGSPIGMTTSIFSFVRFLDKDDNRYIWVSSVGKQNRYTRSTYLINIHFLAKLGHSVFNYLPPKEYEYQGYSHSCGLS